MVKKMITVQLVLIVGKSGSGKTSISKLLGKYFDCEVLNFSKIGRKTDEDISTEEINMIHDQIINCICEKANAEEFIIIEGIASIDVMKKLKEIFNTIVFFLDVPLEIRINRIAERESCTYLCAKEIESANEVGKQKEGLDKVIKEADVIVDGSVGLKEMLSTIVKIINKCTSVENE